MSMWTRLRALVRRRPQNKAFDEPFWRELSGRPSLSGEHVTWKSALEQTTALRCGLVIADSVATVPCKLMRKDPATGRRSEVDPAQHRLAFLIAEEPNGWQDPLQFLESKLLHTVFGGNGFTFLNRVRGEIREMIPLDPYGVTIEQRDDYRLVYRITARNGTIQEFPQESIWHLRGPSWNGWRGLDTVHLAREALGLAMAAQNAHARRFGQGLQTTGVYSFEGALDQVQYQRLQAWIEQNHVGARNSGRPMILDRSGKWIQMDMSGVDAQHVEARRLQVEEVCRAFGVLPIMVGMADKVATYASSEQMFLAHAVHTARPWHRRLERSMKRSLLTEQERRQGYYFKFFDAELLRGAAKDRAQYYAKMAGLATFTPNEIRELEDMDGYDGGDVHLVQSGMTRLEAVGEPGEVQATEPSQAGITATYGASRINVGRVISKANERLIRGSRDDLDTVLAQLAEQGSDDDDQAND